MEDIDYIKEINGLLEMLKAQYKLALVDLPACHTRCLSELLERDHACRVLITDFFTDMPNVITPLNIELLIDVAAMAVLVKAEFDKREASHGHNESL